VLLESLKTFQLFLELKLGSGFRFTAEDIQTFDYVRLGLPANELRDPKCQLLTRGGFIDQILSNLADYNRIIFRFMHFYD
jgi:hypothetical protein